MHRGFVIGAIVALIGCTDSVCESNETEETTTQTTSSTGGNGGQGGEGGSGGVDTCPVCPEPEAITFTSRVNLQAGAKSSIQMSCPTDFQFDHSEVVLEDGLLLWQDEDWSDLGAGTFPVSEGEAYVHNNTNNQTLAAMLVMTCTS